jgi:hypothetical protein
LIIREFRHKHYLGALGEFYILLIFYGMDEKLLWLVLIEEIFARKIS